MTASYAVSVRQASALPAASFRFHLTMDTLAVRLTFPPVGPVEDLHLQWVRPAGRTNKKIRVDQAHPIVALIFLRLPNFSTPGSRFAIKPPRLWLFLFPSLKSPPHISAA